ncbi:BamA/TamA family outer membrane protein [Sphingomonas piscis]|uniref:BamA/TamA family outer membrane protein n=1 Tax=Sphingomonas piscis TaxID=2714943 RepID=A0A6G7YM55_9SPHN|nr:BamA/TamA family outer membrane protein [Sphingomonas piscis]QIK77830.1 BamA/TamA family outer membrane protein [Sphingomonas piscis]
MVGRGKAGARARLLCAAATGLLWCLPALAQQTDPLDPGELDPSAPLDPLPDLGVDWPVLDQSPVTAETPAVPSPTQDDGSASLRYDVAVEGLDSLADADKLLTDFRTQSQLEADRRRTANAAQIERRSNGDAELLAELLRSQGYYDAAVEPRIERAGQSLRVVVAAEPGERYEFAGVSLPGLEGAGTEAGALRQTFVIRAGDPVVAADVIAAGTALKVALGEQGFALAEVGEQDIEIDHEARRATLTLPVRPGPQARFGTIRVAGRPAFSPRHVQTIARFRTGDTFQRSKVDDLRRALIATGLVASAEVQVIPAADWQTVDLAVRLEPAPPRTIAGELGYGTGEGLRAEASWQHRNFITPEGAITLRGIAGTQEQLAAVQFRRNNFARRDQVLNVQASASHQDRDAYEAKTLLLAGNIERQSNIIWQKKWTYSLGAEVLATRERGAFDLSGIKDTRDFLLTAFPVSLGYDSSDDLLDPTTGFRLSGRLSPEISAHGGQFAYGRLQVDASTYQPLGQSVVVAGRVRFGTIVNADTFSIAPTRRFYAGGGGSVRGYGYQQLGPRDSDGDPTGGRSLAEFGLEGRVRLKAFGGNFGLVPFLDGGVLSNRKLPRLSELQFGAGLGLRYYSSFGPIRIDVGTPLNPRSGDGRVAVVVSLGQAF